MSLPMNHRLLSFALLAAASIVFVSCGKKDAGQAETEQPESDLKLTVLTEPKAIEPAKPIVAPAPAPAPVVTSEPGASEEMSVGIGDFGSSEPIERMDMPTRGIISFTTDKKNEVFMPAEHWEQYNFPFEAKRWGRYRVRLTYTLKSATLGVQMKFGEERLKKQLKHGGGAPKTTYLGEVSIKEAGPQFMALYTPNGVGWTTFILHKIELIPTGEEVAQVEGPVELLAKHATTWSTNMRYEPKPEKNCLGFWTEKDDFAEWEFKVDKPGKYEVTVHQGCGAGGGSEVAVELGEQKLMFTVQDTGGFQKWLPVTVGSIEIKEPGKHRILVKPQTKKGGAVMDIQKVVLSPLS
jgi:hypothetical protein